MQSETSASRSEHDEKRVSALYAHVRVRARLRSSKSGEVNAEMFMQEVRFLILHICNVVCVEFCF